MSQKIDPIYTVVAAVDMSETSELVLERAFDMAQRHAPCAIHIVSVLDTKTATSPQDAEEESPLARLYALLVARAIVAEMETSGSPLPL